MRRFLFLGLVILGGNVAFSQTVENIRVEPEEDEIKIHYRIGGSTESQLYNVYLNCSMDGGPRFEPEAVIGDVGENIRGGKSYYTIVWDVFEDVEEVGNAEFFVRVELVSDLSEKDPPPLQEPQQEQPRHQEQPSQQSQAIREESPFEPSFESGETKPPADFERRIFFDYSASRLNLFGLSTGTVGNWGVYGSIRLGTYDEFYDALEGSLTAGITKNIVLTRGYRLHGYAGAGIGDFFDEFNAEGGLKSVIGNRLTLTIGLQYPSYYMDLVFGLGVVF